MTRTILAVKQRGEGGCRIANNKHRLHNLVTITQIKFETSGDDFDVQRKYLLPRFFQRKILWKISRSLSIPCMRLSVSIDSFLETNS